MRIHEWVRYIHPPFQPSTKAAWNFVCNEAQAPLVAAAWCRLEATDKRFFIVVPDSERALQWQARLGLCGIPEGKIKQLPSGLSNLFDDGSPEKNALSDRLMALNEMLNSEEYVVIATANSALEKTISPERFRSSTLDLKIGDEIPTDNLLLKLQAMGYEVEEPVRRPGGMSRRGGIIDIFAGGSEMPTRIEFFGDTIDSLRRFDPESQRSILPVEKVFIPPLRNVVYPDDVEETVKKIQKRLDECIESLNDMNSKKLRDVIKEDLMAIRKRAFFDRAEHYLPMFLLEESCALDYLKGGVVFLQEPLELQTRYERSKEDLELALQHRSASGETLGFHADDYVCSLSRLNESRSLVSLSILDDLPSWVHTDIDHELKINSLAPYRARLDALSSTISNWKKQNVKIIVATDQPTRAKSVLSNIKIYPSEPEENDHEKLLDAPVVLLKGNLAGGFVNEHEKWAVLTDTELFGVGRLRLPQKRFSEGIVIASVLDLKPGDYVVHVQFGIGKFKGLITRKVAGYEKEYLEIEYVSPDKLFVPADQLDRIQKYLSPSDAPPKLNRLSGGDWHRALRSAKRDAEEFARDLLRIYAKRAMETRTPYGEDSPWQAEMEATFPWVETPSQLQSINDIKKDLNKPRPMDRLVCGDVGFGKTEVAIRAAFKVAQAGKQVAVLCPTTVLSDQHFLTFKERLAPYPIKIGLLNRFRKSDEKKQVLEKLKDGSLDIVIGTHALLQKVVSFKNLGLVIVDEEQRFGVKDKERLKELKASADVLTLTATPIPRTLSMSLMQIRSMSLINDPPPGRLPIRTYVRPYNDALVREVLLREMARQGQAFYVFNRIEGIYHTSEGIRKMLPNARIAVAHGQMHADELEPIMLEFYHGNVDILVCTTIIENGIDNPNVNTIVVDGADKLGLAQLYQLRGRVGRSDRQAYAYLLYRAGKQLTHNATERLKALQEFSELGSGYSLAFRDLQIRGAGELLGSKQHGVMANVGYEMYVQLINQAIKQLKQAMDTGDERKVRMTNVDFDISSVLQELPPFEIPSAAYFPKSYIEDESQRLFYYKKLMEVRSEDGIKEMEAELIDRYGKMPDAAINACQLVRLRLYAHKLGLRKVEFQRGRLVGWFAPGRELPVRVVNALSRMHRNLKYRNDMAEWPISGDALGSIKGFLKALEITIEEAQQARLKTAIKR